MHLYLPFGFFLHNQVPDMKLLGQKCDGPRDLWVSEEALTTEGPFLGHSLESDKFSLFECEISVAAPWTGPLSLHWNAFSLLGFLH